ncbi:MAG: LacI family DNA-binding transcriptional regulator [Caldilineaceae bacterium]
MTIRDVARRAGVSISSVSRALSDHPHVSPTLRARVESAAQALGYQPDFLAQRLRRGDTARLASSLARFPTQSWPTSTPTAAMCWPPKATR